MRKDNSITNIRKKREENEPSEIICVREINENIQRIFQNKPLTRPLRTLNQNCEFRKRYDIAFDLKNNVTSCAFCKKEFKNPKNKRFCSKICKARMRKYKQKYNQKPEVKAKMREYYQKPEVKAKMREYYQKPEVKARMRKYMREKLKIPKKGGGKSDKY